MKLRSIQPVPKANILFNQDCKVIARVPMFNLVSLNYDIIYDLEVPFLPAEGESEQIRIINLKGFNETIQAAEINAVLASFEADLNANYNYIENLHAAMKEAFRIKLGMDGKFGLGINDWEIL